jgi:hypothetical protein
MTNEEYTSKMARIDRCEMRAVITKEEAAQLRLEIEQERKEQEKLDIPQS